MIPSNANDHFVVFRRKFRLQILIFTRPLQELYDLVETVIGSGQHLWLVQLCY